MTLRISRQNWETLLAELELARQKRHLLTYRSLIERLELPTPAMQTLATALEYLAGLDAKADRPLRSALVISQGVSRLPRPGFFECASRLNRFNGEVDGLAAASWHASEVARVFEFTYPEVL
ncbi:hypothetical protein WG219_10180 [Ectopseudomonas mendocina]|uniref:Uncharacterized protein n=1 Tax=Ectopseudomonas mendocina TaxID=300 RepID=A0ABZ2RMQ0_ECTME